MDMQKAILAIIESVAYSDDDDAVTELKTNIPLRGKPASWTKQLAQEILYKLDVGSYCVECWEFYPNEEMAKITLDGSICPYCDK
ncbi:MAG: hypothetical protein GY833_16450 [Aestuariibacter sp.]|nr:hypothetical protein [Aestuariibacter sp.]